MNIFKGFLCNYHKLQVNVSDDFAVVLNPPYLTVSVLVFTESLVNKLATCPNKLYISIAYFLRVDNYYRIR